MTVENAMYGGNWVKCARCGVHDALSKRAYDSDAKVYLCVDVQQCATWKAELAAKGLVAGVDAKPQPPPAPSPLEQLKVRPSVDVDLDFATGPRFKPVLVTVPAPPRPPPTTAPSDGVDSGHIYARAYEKTGK